MNVDSIITAIDAEITKLQQARQLLTGGVVKAKVGRPKGSTKKKGGMTEAGRKRISDAMKARWAAKRK